MRDRLLAPTLAVGGGLALFAAQAPAAWWWAAFLAPAGVLGSVLALAHTHPRAGIRARFLVGLVAGIVGYGPMLVWLVLPAGWLAWTLVTLVQATFLGAVTVAVAPWVGRWSFTIAGALAWTGMDALRAAVQFTGFDWGALAYGHVAGSPLLPLASVGGGRLLTLVTVLVAALVVLSAERVIFRVRPFTWRRLSTGRPLLAALVVLALAQGVAVFAGRDRGGVTGVADVLVVQGNDIVDFEGPRREEIRAVARRMLELTRQALVEGPLPDLVIWPENSIDRDPYEPEGADLFEIVAAGAELTQGRLLAGMNLTGPRPGTFRNTMVHVDETGGIHDLYQKLRLVPFGEYVPWRHILGDFPPLRQVPRDGVPGAGPHQVDVNGIRIAAAICFESLFGELIRDNILAGDEPAQLVVISTSDSTFGDSHEPEQHLTQSRLRAVETGRHVVHAAISGTSAFVAPDGSVSQQTGLFVGTTIRAEVPLVTGRTLYLRTGDLLGLPSALAFLGLLAWAASSKRRAIRGSFL